MKYKGHDYEIKFCDPNKDWGEHKGLFCIDCAIGDSEFYPTYAEAEAQAKRNIDDFVKAIPQTKQEWLDAIDSCIIRTGYEDYHLDEVMAWALLQKAAFHLKPDNTCSPKSKPASGSVLPRMDETISYQWAAQAMRGVEDKLEVHDAQTLADRVASAVLEAYKLGFG